MVRRLQHILLPALAAVLSLVYFINYGSKSNIFYGDALGYYSYLPSAFIYRNLDRQDVFPANTQVSDDIRWYFGQMQPVAGTGKKLNQYTYGTALMELPFFAAALCYDAITGHPPDGYSAPYSIMIRLSGMVYCLLGMIITYQVLRRYWRQDVALTTIILICTGTNLFWFTLYQAGMSHVPLFFLYALLIWMTIRVHEKPRGILFAASGFIAGLITIIRPSDAVCLLIPLLYQVHNASSFSTKRELIRHNAGSITTAAFCFLLPVIPQLIYWKSITGHVFYYSYGSQSFNWLHPKIVEGLFYFSNGWLPYSPIMILAIAGMFYFRCLGDWALAIPVVFVVYVYVTYSWYSYNYLNGLGSRPMIHLYPLLAIPFALIIHQVSERRLWLRSAFVMLALFLVAINVSYSVQEPKGILVSVESNIKYNLQMLFRYRLRYDDMVVKDTWAWQPDTARVVKVGGAICQDFNDSLSSSYVRDTTTGSGFVYRMATEQQHQCLSFKYYKARFAGAKWFRCSGRFMYTGQPGYYNHVLVISSGSKLWRGCKIDNKIDFAEAAREHKSLRLDHYHTGYWGEVSFFVPIPKNLTDGDMVSLSIENRDQIECYADNVCVEVYR